MPFQLSQIQPSKSTIAPPDSLSLSFTLTANIGTSYSVFYDLAENNNLFFQLADGSTSKQVVNQGVMPTSVLAFNNVLTIVRKGPKVNSYIFIKVTARSQANGDVKSCKISTI